MDTNPPSPLEMIPDSELYRDPTQLIFQAALDGAKDKNQTFARIRRVSTAWREVADQMEFAVEWEAARPVDQQHRERVDSLTRWMGLRVSALCGTLGMGASVAGSAGLAANAAWAVTAVVTGGVVAVPSWGICAYIACCTEPDGSDLC